MVPTEGVGGHAVLNGPGPRATLLLLCEITVGSEVSSPESSLRHAQLSKLPGRDAKLQCW